MVLEHYNFLLLAMIVFGSVCLGIGLGMNMLWWKLKSRNKAHFKLDLRYDPYEKEISMNGTHRIPSVVLTKENLYKMYSKEVADAIYDKAYTH